MEKRQTSPLPIIGADHFELTEREALKALQVARENVEGWRKLLSDSDESLRNSVQRFLPHVEEQVRALSAPPSEVIARAKTFYDRTIELGNSGIDGDELALQLGDEYPDLMNFYGLLRMKPWGYRLGQSVTAAAAGRRIKSLRGE